MDSLIPNQIFMEYTAISCGNPGALSVLTQILQQFPNFPIQAYQIFEKMKELRLYDYHIWSNIKNVIKIFINSLNTYKMLKKPVPPDFFSRQSLDFYGNFSDSDNF